MTKSDMLAELNTAKKSLAKMIDFLQTIKDEEIRNWILAELIDAEICVEKGIEITTNYYIDRTVCDE